MKLTPSASIWFDGEFVPWKDAQVHVMSHVLHYASSVFEGMRAYATPRGSSILGLVPHVERLFHSCKIMDLPLEHTRQDIQGAITATVKRNGHDACYIRPLVFRGYGALGVWPEECPVHCVIATFPWVREREAEILEKGIQVGVSSWRRMAPDTLPAMAKVAGNYVNSQLVVLEAKRHGYDDGVVLDVGGNVSEGSGQNLFVVQRGRLCTPPVGSSILEGITRRCVLEMAQDLGIPSSEQTIAREVLYTADEVFLTGTAAEITPVRSVDRKPVGDGKRGPITSALQRRFFDVIRGEAEDRRGWMTLVQ